MPSDRTRPSYTRVQRRLLTALAGLVVAALAAGAYVLTYDVLRELALAGRVSRRWAPLYPAMADTLVALTILSLVVTRGARWWTRLLRWALLLVLVAGGAAASVQHSLRGYGPLPDDAVRTGVAVAPHVMLVIAIWLWLTMFKQIRVARPSAEEAAPLDTQRGHVKVLEPAAPPLALEAPAGAEPRAPAAAEEREELIPFPLEPAGPAEPEPSGPESPGHRAAGYEPETPWPTVPDGIAQQWSEPEDEPDAPEPAPRQPREEETAGQGHAGFEDVEYGGSLSSEPEPPPLDALPEPRRPLDALPTLLPTDVELVRSRDREEPEERPVASTTRPDIVLPELGGTDEDLPGPGSTDEDLPGPGGTDEDLPGPGGADEDLHDPPAADRAEDPDAGDGPAGGWNPPPSGNFRSGPTPPAD